MKLWTKQRHDNAPRPRCGSKPAFTFVEVLAALAVMAIVIPVAIHGTQIASRAGVVAQRRAIALRLADGLLDQLIVENSWGSSAQTGSFGEGLEGYQWKVDSEGWGNGDLNLVSVEVSYVVQQRSYSVVLSALAPPEESE